MTLTQTRAWRRSGVVSTSVTVAKPMCGSWTSFARIRADLLAQELVDPVGALAHGRGVSAAAARLIACWVNASMMSPSTRSW